MDCVEDFCGVHQHAGVSLLPLHDYLPTDNNREGIIVKYFRCVQSRNNIPEATSKPKQTGSRWLHATPSNVLARLPFANYFYHGDDVIISFRVLSDLYGDP